MVQRRRYCSLVPMIAVVLLAGLLLFGCDPNTTAIQLLPAPTVAIFDTGRIGWFADAEGGEILYRGVNVNSLGEYWQFHPDLPPTLPFTEADADFVAAMGLNLVRLLITWSSVEPQPGEYDRAYLDTVKAYIERLWKRGIFTLIDLHQDAWGPFLNARPNEVCEPDEFPATGWDGAPQWATLVDAATRRCVPVVNDHPVRELSPAVQEAWDAFFSNKEGPGGIGIRDRYAAMLGHLARILGPLPGVMGYDLMNEPNAIFGSSEYDGLTEMYVSAVAEIRAGEKAAGIAPRIILFEPSAYWAGQKEGGTVEPFTDDFQVAYGPHIYQGSIFNTPLDDEQVQRVRDDAARYGGIPVLTGEWGGGTDAATSETGYFATMISLQDAEHWGAALWQYQGACGDPHAHYGFVQNSDQVRQDSWGLRATYCDGAKVHAEGPVNTVISGRLTRPALHKAPGRIHKTSWDPIRRIFTAEGVDAKSGNHLRLFLPEPYKSLQIEIAGLENKKASGAYKGVVVEAIASGGIWSVTARP